MRIELWDFMEFQWRSYIDGSDSLYTWYLMALYLVVGVCPLLIQYINTY